MSSENTRLGEFLTTNTFSESNEGLNLMPAWRDPAHRREFGHLKEMAVTVLSPRSWAVEQIIQTTEPIVKIPILPVELAGMVLEAPRKRQHVAQAVLPFWCDSHGAGREQPLTALLAPSLPSFHSFHRHTLVPGAGRERAASKGSSSTLPSLEGSHVRARMSLHKCTLCRGCGAQPASPSLSPFPHGVFIFP